MFFHTIYRLTGYTYSFVEQYGFSFTNIVDETQAHKLSSPQAYLGRFQ